MITFIYVIQPKTGMEDAFFSASWSLANLLKLKSGSLGSRLYRSDDNKLVSISMWPSAEHLENSRSPDPELDAARDRLDRSVEKFEAMFVLNDVVFNCLEDLPPKSPQGI
ncbi:MAG: antibiotic biosynthesis monooxygenase family protein [Novosphingobium sp.]